VLADPDRVPLYGLDIETDTTTDGLDPSRSAVVAVAIAGPGADEVLDLPDPSTGAPVGPADEAGLLRRLDDRLRDLAPGVLITWNGRGFDLPFLRARADLLAVPIGLRTDDRTGESTWFDHRHLDGLRPYRADVGRTFGLSCGLKALARLVGERPVEVDRERIHELGRRDLHDYVLSDARLARSLVTRRWPQVAPWVDRVAVPDVGA
jgi:uncharacterized protein YprB with RNaseH-like and TPR domain